MTCPDGGNAVNFHELLEQVLACVQRQGRVSYRALKQQFDLNDEYLEDLKEEIIYAKQLAVDEGGRVLVWTGDTATPQTGGTLSPALQDTHPSRSAAIFTPPQPPDAE